MGRHSLPEDEPPDEPADDGAGPETGDLALDDEPRGRHSWRAGAEQSVAVLEPEALAGADTAPVPVVTETEPVPAVGRTAPVPVAAETERVRKPSGTHADLALLRADRRLRIRAALAVLAPFALYVLVLAVLGRLDVFLPWVWIPVIVAGVSFGAVLDLGFGKASRPGDSATESDDVSG